MHMATLAANNVSDEELFRRMIKTLEAGRSRDY
jgi:hypothetical protein